MLHPETPQSAHLHAPGLAPRTLGLGFVLLLHTVAIYALATALHLVPAPNLPVELTVRTLPPPPKTAEEPPPPLPPILLEPLPAAPPIEPVIDLSSVPPAGNAISNPPAIPMPPLNDAIPALPITAARSIDGTHTSPEYPMISRRLGEQGSVRLQLTIGEDGMVTMAKILRSSGFKRLDEAAVDWVARHWRYRPAMRGAMPVESSIQTVMEFRLN
jgi:protein TonB